MRSFLLALFLLAPLAAAQQKELVLSATANKPEVVTGERVTITATVTNQSSQTVTAVTVRLGFTRSTIFTAVSAPDGWTCSTDGSVTCERPSFAAGATATFTATAYVPLMSPGEPVRAQTIVSWVRPNGGIASTSVVVPLVVRPAALQTDLAVTFAPPARSIRLGESGIMTLNVRNNGPADATNVIVQISSYEAGATVVAAPGSGWSCNASTASTICSRPRINAGETAPLDVRVQAPQQAGRRSLIASVFAEEMHDLQPSNNFASAEVSFGNAEDYERVLIPVSTAEPIPGQGGALWETDVLAFIDSPTPIELFLECYVVCIPTRVPVPPRHIFGAVEEGMLPPSVTGSFAAFRRGDAAKVKFNTRVRDRAREAESWGTEIPAVREHEFHTGTIVLMPLPLDDRFRHTVRVYDDGFSNGGRVAIRVFFNNETTPRLNIVRRLIQEPGDITPAALPLYPGFTQLDPIFEADAQDVPSGIARVEVESLTPGLRFWAFATVTNEQTSRVTTITPQ